MCLSRWLVFSLALVSALLFFPADGLLELPQADANSYGFNRLQDDDTTKTGVSSRTAWLPPPLSAESLVHGIFATSRIVLLPWLVTPEPGGASSRTKTTR
jgi:hypothetical protein